jgi:hypothetical protein
VGFPVHPGKQQIDISLAERLSRGSAEKFARALCGMGAGREESQVSTIHRRGSDGFSFAAPIADVKPVRSGEGGDNFRLAFPPAPAALYDISDLDAQATRREVFVTEIPHAGTPRE